MAMTIQRRRATQAVDYDSLRLAESVAKREFPDAVEVHASPTNGSVVVEVWREDESTGKRRARVFGLTGEVL